MAHDVFISFSHEEADIAMSVVTGLEERDIKCWISSRDIPAGADYAEQIMYGIKNSRLVVLILSSNTSKSPHVRRELDRALRKKIEILPFQIEEVELSEAMEYFVSIPQWLNALTPPLESHFEKLAVEIQKIFVKQKMAKTNKAISSGKEFFDAKNYIEARKHFEIVKKIDSENKDAIYYLNEIDRLEHEKSETIANNLAACKEALEVKNPFQARLHINKVLELDKENAEALALQKEVQKLEQERKKIITQGIEAGKKALRSGNYNQAIKYFKEVLELDRDNQEVRNLLNESEKLEADKQKGITELLNLGIKELNAGNYKLSIKHFRNVLELEKENKEALNYLTKINQIDKKRKLKIAEALTLGKRLLKSGYKNKAKELFEEVLKLDPKKKEALRVLNEIQLSVIPSTIKKYPPKAMKIFIGIGLFVIVVAIFAYFSFRPEPPFQKLEDVEAQKSIKKPKDVVAQEPIQKPEDVLAQEPIAKRLDIVKESIAQKDLSSAQTEIEEIVNEAPDNIQAQDLNKEVLKLINDVSQLTKLGREAQANDKYLKAREYYMDILEIDKNNENAHLMLASINQYLEKKEKTLISFGEKNLKDRNIKEAKRQYMEVLDLNSKNKKAKEALSKISGIEKQIAFFNQQANEALKNEDYNEAEINYKKVLDLHRKNKEALKGIKKVKPLHRQAEVKPLAIMLKDQKLEFFPESDKRLNFGEIKEKETVKKTIKFQSYLNKKIEFGLHGCNWKSKKQPLDMMPIEFFDSQLLTLKPNESAILQISLTMPEGTELPGGQYTGELLFKDLKGEYDYRISFYFMFTP